MSGCVNARKAGVPCSRSAWSAGKRCRTVRCTRQVATLSQAASAANGFEAEQPVEAPLFTRAYEAVGAQCGLAATAALAWARHRGAALAASLGTKKNVATCMEALKNVKRGGMVLPFAAASAGALDAADLFLLLNQAVFQFVNLYLLFLFLRVILSWFPTFDWERNPWRALRQVTDPYLNIFTGLVPPLLGAIDLTPMIGFFVLQALKGYLNVYDEDDIETWW